MATSGDRNLAIDIQEAAEYGYTSVGSSQWAAAMIAYYDGDFTKADSRWTMLPSTQWSDGQPLKDVIYWLDLARVRRAAGHLAEARELLDRLDVTLRQFANPGRMAEWVAEEAAQVPGRSAALAAPLHRTPSSRRLSGKSPGTRPTRAVAAFRPGRRAALPPPGVGRGTGSASRCSS